MTAADAPLDCTRPREDTWMSMIARTTTHYTTLDDGTHVAMRLPKGVA